VQDVKETLSSLRTTSSGADALRGRRSQNVKAGARRGSTKNGFVKLRSQRTRKAAQQLRVQVVGIPTELVRHGHNHGHRVAADVLARESRPRNRLLVSLINPVGNNVTGQQRNAETRTRQRNRRSKLRNSRSFLSVTPHLGGERFRQINAGSITVKIDSHYLGPFRVVREAPEKPLSDHQAPHPSAPDSHQAPGA